MKNVLSFTFFLVVFLGIGALALAAAPQSEGTAKEVVANPSTHAGSSAAAPTASSSYNLIAIPLDSTQQFTDAGLSFDAEGLADLMGAGVEQVLEWDAGNSIYNQYFPIVNGPTNFPLAVGGTYFLVVNSAAGTGISFVGDVPAAGTITNSLVPGGGGDCTYNAIMVPLDQSGITDASALAAALGGSTDVSQILNWNAASQQWEQFFPVINGPINFSVQIGYPYFACMNSSAATQWP